ncbi:MAG TPA: LPS export ABC transporter periplasmic protein LptC [Vicinamibacterales bacterium]|nr:LPS export ABC transporter periplasmic protein LptC [Vicinamibacterales bacterium]
MASWQKRARFLVLAIAIGVVAVVFATTRRRETPPPATAVERGDLAATIESSGAFLVQMKGDKETVRVEAEKQYSYPDGSIRLVNAKVTSTRQGETFVATSAEARVGENQTNLDMKGNVVITSNNGLEAKGDSATYSQSEGVMRGPGAVTFKRGRMSGSGVDFTYDETRDMLALADQTHVILAPEKKGGEVTDITSGASVLARTDKFMSFERAVHIVRGTQVIDADSAIGEFSENQEHLTSLELTGSARIETPNPKPGELKLMSGDVINLMYYENSDVLQSATVTGGAALRIAAVKGSEESVLHADNIEIGMAADGSTLTSLNARDHVVFDLSTLTGQPAKKVISNALVASGEAGKGLTVASFTEGVEYSEIGGTPPLKRTVTSRTLDTSLKGGLGQIQEATFLGSARFRDWTGSMQAAGSTMRYNMDTGQVALAGVAGEPVPRVVNDQIQVDATNIEMNVEGSKMYAYGESRRVQSIMFPAKPGATGAARTPGLMKQDLPIQGVSSKLNYVGGENGTIELTGTVMLVQGEKSETQIKGEKIVIDGKTGNLVAEGSVISQMVVQDVNATTKERETARSTGYGQQMQYDDALRKVTYANKAHLVGPQGDLTGNTIVLTLGKNGQDIERLEASGEARMQEVDRITHGDLLTYDAAKEEYVVIGKGKLVRTFRRTPEGDCRRHEGSVLTFKRGTDSLQIDGGIQARAQTAADTACPAPPKR